MYNRSDPRFRRTLNQISHNLESANESAQVGLFSFSQFYLKPCFASITNCMQACTEPCCPGNDERVRNRRRRGLSRGRPELNFDFYDDWDEDENDALLSMGNDELDRLLGGGQITDRQPGQQKTMNYGSQAEGRAGRARGKSAVQPYDVGPDPNVIPSQSAFGFLSKLPFNIGTKGLRYKPSAADLKERHPRTKGKGAAQKKDTMVEEDEENEGETHGRHRSGTTSSLQSHDSYSSRGDIFPSDDEDAVALDDDEFTFVLERRTTGQDDNNSGSGKARGSKRPSNSRTSTRTQSSKSTRTRGSLARQESRASNLSTAKSSDSDMVEVPSLATLRQEELMVQEEEETRIEQNRQAAQRLARERGLSAPDSPVAESNPESRTASRAASDQQSNPSEQNPEDAHLSPFPPLLDPTEAEAGENAAVPELDQLPSPVAQEPPERAVEPATAASVPPKSSPRKAGRRVVKKG